MLGGTWECFVTLCPSPSVVNNATMPVLNSFVFFPLFLRIWFTMNFSLCWEALLDFVSSVWYLEKRRIGLGVGVWKSTRIF